MAGQKGALSGATLDVLSGLFGLGAWALGAVLVMGAPRIGKGRYQAWEGGMDLGCVGAVSALSQLVLGGLAGGFFGRAQVDTMVPAVGDAFAAIMLVGFLGFWGACKAGLVRKLASVIVRKARERSMEFFAPLRSMLKAHTFRVSEQSAMSFAAADDVGAHVDDGDGFVSRAVGMVDNLWHRCDSADDSGEVRQVQVAALRAVDAHARKTSPIVLLTQTPASGSGVDEGTLWAEGEALCKVLAAYDVECRVEGVSPGPVVSTIEVSMPVGTKFSKVVGLADDLGLQLGRKVRIAAGKLGRVAIEIENETPAVVGLREVLEDGRFAAPREGGRSVSDEMALPVALGRDVRGEVVVGDLAEMPHLIVAGSTGSGKSVALHAMLVSLLSVRTPEEVRLLLVDPKMVEFTSYVGAPHMLASSVTTVGGASAALGWCCEEMDRRYEALARSGSKNIAAFNARAREGEKLARIVVVVDELSDLMMQDKKGIEPLIVRLGQKARAAGIHVILATQRPSADVVTGLIKANFPCRLGLRVASAVDSRVVLDEAGGEQLIGKGDALYKSAGGKTIRVQCPWVADGDVDALVRHLGQRFETEEDKSLVRALRDVDGGKTNGAGRGGRVGKLIEALS
jgi:S-DNA-T family DNA segregation ATPase FtsK/SpoIIIE